MADDGTGEQAGWWDQDLDDDFVASAFFSELSADERIALAERRRSEEIADIDGTKRIRHARRRTKVVAYLATVAMIATLFVLSESRRNGPVSEQLVHSGADHLGSATRADLQRPTPTPSPNGKPLGRPPALPVGSGKYAFLAVQPTDDRPVAYDPCRPIRYVVNAETAPAGAADLLAQAVQRMSAATGLQFLDDGTTDEVPEEQRELVQPDRYGDRWAPVIIWWAAPSSAPMLEGQVAGYAGSASIEINDGDATSRVYVSGTVVLDGPQLSGVLEQPSGTPGARAVILHELGHLVGLDHVQDSTQIMNPEGSGVVTDFADGDLRGLNELGRGRCFESL